MACLRTTFTAYVTRIRAEWLNKVDAIVVALGCANTTAEVRANLGVLTSDEIQVLINNLQSQVNTLSARVEALEDCLPDGYCFKVVASLPASPEANIIYYVTG